MEIIADPSRFSAGLRSAENSTSAFANHVSKLGRGALAGSISVSGLGRSVAFASAQFLGGYGLFFALSRSAEAAIKFDSEMQKLQTQAGVSKNKIAGLSKAVLELAPAVGQTPEALAKGLYHIESSGYHGALALKMLKVAAQEASIGGADLETVATALSAAFRSEGASAGELGNIMGTVNAIVGVGNLRLQDLTKALSSGVLPSGRAFGIHLREVGAALDVLTHAGIPAQVASNRLRTTFAFLGGQSKPTAKALKEIGLSASTLAKVIRGQGLLEGLKLLAEHLNSVGATDRARIITQAFGASRSSSTIITLLSQLGQMQTNLTAIDKGAASFKNSWAGYLQTAQASVNRLKASLDVLAITVGHALEPTVTSVSNSMAHWLRSSKHQQEVQRGVSDAVKGTVFAVREFIAELNFVAKPFGGVINLAKVLIALKFVSMFSQWATSLKLLTKRFQELAMAQTEVAKTAGSMAAAETAASTATTVSASKAAVATAATAATQKSLLGGSAFETAILSTGAYKAGAAKAGGGAMDTALRQSQYQRLYGGHPLAGEPAGIQVGKAYLGRDVASETYMAAAAAEAAAAKTATREIGFMAAASGLASRALGTAGLAGVALLGGIMLSGVIRKLPYWESSFRKLGGWAEKIAGTKISPAPSQPMALSAVAAAVQALRSTGSAGKIGPRIFGTSMDAIGHMTQKQISEFALRQHFVVDLATRFHLSKHDAAVFLQEAYLKIREENRINKLYLDAHVQNVTGGPGSSNARSDHPFVMPRFTVDKIPTLDRIAKLDQEMAKAQLDFARGDKAATTRIVEILKERIAYDARYAKIQEGLVSTDAKNAKKHSDLVTKFLNDEAQSYQQMQDALKNSFSVSTATQIGAIKASTTAGLGDDIKYAKQVRDQAMKAIRSGKLTGDALLQAWQDWASAVNTVNSNKKQIQIPIKLQIEQAEAALTASTKDDQKSWAHIAAWARQQLKTVKGVDKVSVLGILGQAISGMAQSLSLPLKLQIKEAEAALTVTTMDDDKVNRQIYNYWKAVAARQKKLGHMQAYLQAIQNEGAAFQNLHSSGSQTSYEMASTHNLTAGMNLSRAKRIEMEQRIAQAESHGGRRPKEGEMGALGYPINVTVDIHGDYIKKGKITQTLQHEARTSGVQRRGRNGGGYLGIH